MHTNETQQNPDDGDSLEKKETAAHAEEEMSMADLLKAEGEVSSKIYSRDIVKVRVVQITAEHVLVDIGEKKEAVIPVADFQDGKMPEIGAEVMAVLERKGGEHTVLSHRKAMERMAWAWAKKMFEAKERVKGRVTDVVKGGYIVDLSGLRAFMPLSLSEIGGAHKHYLPANAKVRFYITDFSEKDRKVVVSRRQVLEEDEKSRRNEVLGTISPGGVVRAVVAKATPEGLSVRFQGIEGFIALQDVDWKNPAEALKSYKRGQRVKCKILSVDKEKEKMSFGLRQLMPNPVDVLKRKFPYRSVLKMKVLSVSEAGAKGRISEQVEAFIPAEEYGFETALKEGQELRGVLIAVNPETYELVLSVKKLEEMEDRKKVQQYMKGAPTLTLGQILLENSEDEGEA
ncbi:MAG: S1 RNA-binding domain-containing protein [Elusimicrobiales bacterium]|jgi:ribosomal protein S1